MASASVVNGAGGIDNGIRLRDMPRFCLTSHYTMQGAKYFELFPPNTFYAPKLFAMYDLHALSALCQSAESA